MNLVNTSALYLDYPISKILRVTKLLETAEKLYPKDGAEYTQYLVEHTYQSDIVLRDLIRKSLIVEYKNVSISHEYRGVTVYKNPDKTYSCPELGIYSIETSGQMKEMIKSKLASVEQVKENIELVIDNILNSFVLTESEFIEYVLENITEAEFIDFGGKYFKDFVVCINQITESSDVNINSLLLEGYQFDEGFGDFVRNVSSKAKDAIDAGTDRHTAAQAKLGQALSTPGKTALSVGNKLKSAASKTFTKQNLNTAGAVVNAAAGSFNKLASNIAKGVEVGAKTFDNVNTDALESKRAELRAKNAEDPKAKIDREAEAASDSKPKPLVVAPKKKATVKDKEAAYDKVMSEHVLNSVKTWLDESEIFNSEEELDDYIMNEMSSEDLSIILDSLSLDEGAASIEKQRQKNMNRDINAATRKAKSISDAAQLANTVSRFNAKDEIAAQYKSSNFEPTKKTQTPLGKAIAPPKNRNALVPVGKSYDTPPEYPTTSAPASSTGHDTRISGRPAGYMTNKPMPQVQIPSKKSTTPQPDYKGYTTGGKFTALSKDNMASTPLGKYQKTKSNVSNALAASDSKPSNIVSSFGEKTKNYAQKILKKLNPIKESVVVNWLLQEELLDITCWLIESDNFQYQNEILEYLNEYLTWNDVHNINAIIENTCLDILVDCIYENYDNSLEILDVLYEHIGSDYYDYILNETHGSDSDVLVDTNKEPISNKKAKNKVKVFSGKLSESKDCNCDKSSCKSCDNRKFTDKLYKKIRGK